MKYLDNLIDRVTMYRLVLYQLITFVVVGLILMTFGLIPYSPINLLFNIVIILSLCWLTNQLFSLIFSAPTNAESVYITSLMLILIIGPLAPIENLAFLVAASIIAMSSKYLLAWHKKHLFNPTAIALLICTIVFVRPPVWWVGSIYMFPIVAIAAFVLSRKTKKLALVLAFSVAAGITLVISNLIVGLDWITLFKTFVLASPYMFVVSFMITEPMTMPPTRNLQIVYGAIVGALFGPTLVFQNIWLTPPLAIVVGNLFSYLVSPKQKLVLTLKEKIRISPDAIDFVFMPDVQPKFKAGQYMEFTLPHPKVDSRGNRRYFTVAASPTEGNIQIGVKFAKQSSTFKYNLAEMPVGSRLIAGQLAGEFVLPKDPTKKLIFMAGGIGITPFRSMLKYLIDTKESRPIILFYSNNTREDIVFKEVLDQAEKDLKIKTVYTLTNTDQIPADWIGKTGFIDQKMVEAEVPSYKDCEFYISGPHAMVVAMEDTIRKMGVSPLQIKTDFFPGYI